jgi:proteic killer suppression protein
MGADLIDVSCRAMIAKLDGSSHLHHVTETVTLRQAKRMIKSFRHKGLKRLFETGDHRGVPPELAQRISRLLDALDAAGEISELNLPGFGLHELKGNRKETWALKVNKNWRITCRFGSGNAYDVGLEDYH